MIPNAGKWGAVVLLGFAGMAQAFTFDFDIGNENIEGVSNTTLIGGAAIRLEERKDRLIAKGHLDTDVCGRTPDGNLYFQACQGLFRNQTFPAEKIAQARGYGSSNFDQGNLNYDQGDLTQSGARFGQDVLLTWGDYGFFAKGFAFWDPVNDNFDENYVSYIDSGNFQDVGYASFPGSEIIRAGNLPQALGVLGPLVSGIPILNATIVGELLANPLGIPTLSSRNDSAPCSASRNPRGQPCGVVYGPGGRKRVKRDDNQTLREIGKGLVLQELNVFGTFDIPGKRELLVKIGRQQVQWGESTIEFFDSINIANPPSLNNLFRFGGNGLDDFYQPVNMFSLSTSLFEGASISAFYQLEWQPLEAPAAGGFYSPVNAGTNDGGPEYATIGFGQFGHDPEGIGMLLDNPLSGITNTSSRIQRLGDREPASGGQIGVQIKYYAEWLNDGTDFGFHYANYHSRTPIISFISVDEACSKNAGNAAAFALACPDIPLLNALLTPNRPDLANSDAVGFDSAKVFLEYPENIQMYGLSFNTTFGELAVQGEVAYRPNDPLQVAIVDLAFGAFGPTLSNCHIPPGCLGSNVGLGTQPDGSVGLYGSSDFVLAPGEPLSLRFPDTFDLVIGHLPGSGRSFPSFVIPYRGGTVGTNPGNSYIRGYEEFETYSFNLGATLVEGTTDLSAKLLGADQVIWLFELGARWVPDLPALDRLQLEAPGIEWHASAGADGTGADRSRQACSTNLACSFGPDGLRFNPHQQNRDLFPDDISAGYSIVALIRYESILPSISLQPQVIFKHDVYNTSPGLASNYIEGRIIWDTGVEIRYKSNFSVNVGYQLFAGGGVANLLSDRDNARFFLKYAF
ncbi:MAG: DUF1302 domain-containing protein [Panacagrimonas sp.]